jgi:hypothetical protein
MTSEAQLLAYKKYHATDKFKENNRKWLKSEKRKKWLKEYRKSAKFKEYLKKYRTTDTFREYNRKLKAIERTKDGFYQKKHSQLMKSPKAKLLLYLRNRLNSAIKRGSKQGSAVRDLGCSIDELKAHLEKQFKTGMTWDNWGEWHIDHIIPLASFNLTDREQLLKAVNFSNLQPLWAKENILKRDKILNQLPSTVM